MLYRSFAAFVILISAPAVAEDRGYPPSIQLLSTGKNIVGETIHYPTTGPAHITAVIATMAPGSKTIAHKHGVPLFGYILDGELTVDYGAHGIRTYKKGQAVMEAMDVEHFGMNHGTEPVRLLIVYMGAEGAKNVIPVR